MRGRRFLFPLLGLALILSHSACSTVTIKQKGKARLSTEPDYESRKSYFLWGLVGEHSVDAKKICGRSAVRQMQAQDTFVDSLLGIITLGIYRPRTAKVWCNRRRTEG